MTYYKILLINLICYFFYKTYEIFDNYTNILNKYSINININNINKLKFLNDYTEEEKGYYLSGLFEGDGNIYTRRFIIVFSIEDAELAPGGGQPPLSGGLAHYLCQHFKMGYIDGKYNSKKELTAVAWYIINQSDQKKFINYINGKLLTYKRYDQFYKYNFDKSLKIMLNKPKEFNVLMNPWLTGFTDADGYFYLGFQLYKNSLWLKFHLELSQKDKYILEIIQKYFNLGNIIKRNYSSDITAYIYKAQSEKAIKPFIEYFNNYPPLSVRRYKQYLLLNIAYNLKLNNLHKLHNSLLMLKELILLQSIKYMSLNMKEELNKKIKNIVNYYKNLRNLNDK